MSNNTNIKREIEILREQLTHIMENCNPAEALELSKKLDELIVEYQRSGGLA